MASTSGDLPNQLDASLAESLLAGLKQPEDAEDDRFEAQAESLTEEDMFGETSPAEEVQEAGGDSLTTGNFSNVQNYLEAFNEDPSLVTLDDLLEANEQLQSEEALVPKEEREGFEVRSVSQLEHDYGPNWSIGQDPTSGKLVVADESYFGKDNV